MTLAPEQRQLLERHRVYFDNYGPQTTRQPQFYPAFLRTGLTSTHFKRRQRVTHERLEGESDTPDAA